MEGFSLPSSPAFSPSLFTFLFIINLLACQQEHHPNGKSKAFHFDLFDEKCLWSFSV